MRLYLPCYRKYLFLGYGKPSGTESYMNNRRIRQALICGWAMLASTLSPNSLRILGQLSFEIKKVGAFQR